LTIFGRIIITNGRSTPKLQLKGALNWHLWPKRSFGLKKISTKKAVYTVLAWRGSVEELSYYCSCTSLISWAFWSKTV